MTYQTSSRSKTERNPGGLSSLRRNDLGSNPRELAKQLAFSRREFLRSAAGVTLGSTLLGSGLLARAGVPQRKRKVVVITFGGGARDQETFAPEGQENIPHLMRELIPQSTFFTQVVNRGILGHYVATAVTGCRTIFVPGVVRESRRGCGDWPLHAARDRINHGNEPSNTAFVDDLKIQKESSARDKNVQELAATLG